MIIAAGVRKKETDANWEPFMVRVREISDVSYAACESWLNSEGFPYFIFSIKEVEEDD